MTSMTIERVLFLDSKKIGAGLHRRAVEDASCVWACQLAVKRRMLKRKERRKGEADFWPSARADWPGAKRRM